MFYAIRKRWRSVAEETQARAATQAIAPRCGGDASARSNASDSDAWRRRKRKKMQRIGFCMRLLPGKEAESRRRHEQVWPDLLADLHAAGARNYSIFLRGSDLFAYLEVE